MSLVLSARPLRELLLLLNQTIPHPKVSLMLSGSNMGIRL